MIILKRIALVVGLTLLSLLVISEWGRVDAAELDEEDFVPLATQGFLEAVDGPHPEGSLHNNYIWSMRWWRDKLYAGTVRDLVCLASEAFGQVAPSTLCPPPGTLTPEQRAEIWQYTPGGEDGSRGTWQRVFQSPLLLGSLPELPSDAVLPVAGDLTQVPRDVGYRNMIDCETGGQQHLYVATFGVGGRILYTPDGTTFLPASGLGLNLVNDLGYRAVACWRGRLWISPAGAFSIDNTDPEAPFARIHTDNALRPVLLVNDNPSNRTSPWRQVVDVATDPQLGDEGNVGIYSMAVFADALYLGVASQTTGFEIWKADGSRCRTPPGLCVLSWEKLIDDGGGRPVPAGETPNNARIFDFDVFNGHLYWGAAEVGTVKITTPEMGRIGPDGRWDLIVGEPRDAGAMAAYPNFNCQLEDSSCVPLSGLGPGFGPTPLTQGSLGYIWQFEPHEGVLYAGTLDVSGFIAEAVLGFDLWRSRNGIDWTLVSNDGFGNPANYGVRTMASSPFGLFVGTANPFATEDLIAFGIEGGTGGAEVWLGISR